jgi:hypothetical protein
VGANSRSIKPSNDPRRRRCGRRHLKTRDGTADRRGSLAPVGPNRFAGEQCSIYIGKKFSDYTHADFSNRLAVNLAVFFHITQASSAEMTR